MSNFKRLFVVFALFAANSNFGATLRHAQLSVTGYGSLEIAMMRHGEKYATNRACYRWEDVSPLYHGLTHVRGLNDKRGKVTFFYSGSDFLYRIALHIVDWKGRDR